MPIVSAMHTKFHPTPTSDAYHYVINDFELQWSVCTRDLGVYIDKGLKCVQHISKNVHLAHSRSGLIFKSFLHTWPCNSSPNCRLRGQNYPQHTKSAITPKRLKIEPCGLVTLSKTVWAKNGLRRLLMRFHKPVWRLKNGSSYNSRSTTDKHAVSTVVPRFSGSLDSTESSSTSADVDRQPKCKTATAKPEVVLSHVL